MYGDAERRFFLVELRYTRKLWSLEKAVAKNLNVKFRSKFNHGFTKPDSLQCVILKVL